MFDLVLYGRHNHHTIRDANSNVVFDLVLYGRHNTIGVIGLKKGVVFDLVLYTHQPLVVQGGVIDGKPPAMQGANKAITSEHTCSNKLRMYNRPLWKNIRRIKIVL